MNEMQRGEEKVAAKKILIELFNYHHILDTNQF